MSLDLTPGHGNLLGESYWELISPYAGGAWTLNTGVSPRGARESSLSRILQGAPPTKYYLTPRACLGILRRAFERGKALPKKLERALKIQAGLALPDGQVTDVDAYHINQRDEGIDLQGVSGALMATSNTIKLHMIHLMIIALFHNLKGWAAKKIAAQLLCYIIVRYFLNTLFLLLRLCILLSSAKHRMHEHCVSRYDTRFYAKSHNQTKMELLAGWCFLSAE